MATTFKVILYPAEQQGTNMLMHIDACDNPAYPAKTFEATKTAEAVKIAQDYAEAYGQPCMALILCLSKFKPSDFDRTTTGLFYNMPA